MEVVSEIPVNRGEAARSAQFTQYAGRVVLAALSSYPEPRAVPGVSPKVPAKPIGSAIARARPDQPMIQARRGLLLTSHTAVQISWPIQDLRQATTRTSLAEPVAGIL
jgi:hypothetical protein